ncbi:MAG: NifU family protein [Bacteroidetes bacterium]|nr:MAG: NifU family protein [Bacteroidota bacterium]REK36336.1 MAG: NifU family protein [Bacteroidota bacterium]REK50998.1 MAG: NifU family protein [Bacteroidota bacterium]
MEIKKAVTVYAESTPNPASMKFVLNFKIVDEGSVEYNSQAQAGNCPLAYQLLSFSGISSVFITSNYITLSKNSELDWHEQIPILREFIRNYFMNGEPVFTGPREQIADPSSEKTRSSSALESKIIETLDEYVKPAVEQDGGAIHFKSFHEGKVTVTLRGACSGCPSSTITLKNGIENLLKQFVPEVTEVVAENE